MIFADCFYIIPISILDFNRRIKRFKIIRMYIAFYFSFLSNTAIGFIIPQLSKS